MKKVKILCSSCNKRLSSDNYYKFLINDNIYKCKSCVYNEFLYLTNKFSCENKALLIMCEKYNIIYDEDFYSKLKDSCKGNTFTNYIRCSSTILKKNSFSKFISILNKYLNANNIKIDNIFSFDYKLHFEKSNLLNYLNNANIDPLYFIVNFHNKKFAGYLFNFPSSNYYKDISNLIFDVKFFIEKEAKITLTNLPDTLTIDYLKQNNTILFYELLNSPIDSCFELINHCYPNTFKKSDFKGSLKKFDSNEESLIDLVLKENFKNVIYNSRSFLNIKLNHMVPDWIILTNKGCIICEYFGFFVDNYSVDFYNYKEKTISKLDKYSNFENYFFLFIYKQDLENNYEILNDKINSLKTSLNLNN